MTSELKQMKEAAKLNFQFGAGTTSDKIDEFVEKGSTSVFSYLVSPDLQKARLVNLGTMSDAPDDISKICVALLVLFFVLVVAAAVASVFTISWCALAANLIGIIELLAVYFFVFAGKFSIDPDGHFDNQPCCPCADYDSDCAPRTGRNHVRGFRDR